MFGITSFFNGLRGYTEANLDWQKNVTCKILEIQTIVFTLHPDLDWTTMDKLTKETSLKPVDAKSLTEFAFKISDMVRPFKK